MKKITTILLSLLFASQLSYAAPVEIPDEFYITQHWLSLTTSFDIETPTQKLGTLYRRYFSFLLTYDFYDAFNNQLATAQSRFFTFGAHFDIFDNQSNFLGGAEEKIFTFFPTFDIYARDGSTRLARAQMNFWGTTFTLYDPVTNIEMATMYRSFFRLKNDWSITITNRPLFQQKNIDTRVLLTVLAFQGDREQWERDKRDQDNKKAKQANLIHSKAHPKAKAVNAELSTKQLKAVLAKIDYLTAQEGLNALPEPQEEELLAVANELEKAYEASSTEQVQTNHEKIAAFIDYCMDEAQSGQSSDAKKKAILSLLKMRLEKFKP